MGIKNMLSDRIEQHKINKKIILKSNEFNKLMSSLSNVKRFSELLSKLEEGEQIFNDLLELDKGYKKQVLTTQEEYELSVQAQIKKYYFSHMEKYLLKYSEVDSIGYINGFIDDMKSSKSKKYYPYIKSFLLDAEKVLDNHSVIYNNYRKKPIDYYKDDASPSVLQYITNYKKINNQQIMSSLNLGEFRVSRILNYFETQEIVSPRNVDGTRDVYIKDPFLVFPTGLNPNLLSYFSVAYGDEIINDKEKSLIEIIDNDISGAEFEKMTKLILESNGFDKVQTTPISGDFGVDVLAEKNSIKYAIQCKKYSSNVGIKAVQEVIGSKSMNGCHVAVVLTNNYFTSSAKKLAEKNNVLLWDRNELLKLISNMKM